MNKKKLLKRAALLGGITFSLGIAFAAYLWFMPHRDVQEQTPDLELTASDLVERYLTNPSAANDFFLKEDGDSKILAISGTISQIKTNQAGATVILVKDENQKAGVLCTLTTKASTSADSLTIGQTTKIKGVIRAGAEYSDLMGIYIDAVMEDCAPINS